MVLLLLWLIGAPSSGPDLPNGLSARLAGLDKQIQQLASRPTPARVEPKTVDELAARVSKLENAPAGPTGPSTDPAVLSRLESIESAVKSVADKMAALSRNNDQRDAALRDTQGRLDKLAANLGELQAAARAPTADRDQAARLALAAWALRDAVARSSPFGTELAVVKALKPDAEALTALEPFAASGVPTDAALGKELAALIRPMRRASGEPTQDAGFLERLQANAEKLVRVRPIDQADRNDGSAVLARIEQQATRGDISAAEAELSELPSAERAKAQQWIAKVQARKAAIEASRRISDDAIAALKATR